MDECVARWRLGRFSAEASKAECVSDFQFDVARGWIVELDRAAAELNDDNLADVYWSGYDVLQARPAEWADGPEVEIEGLVVEVQMWIEEHFPAASKSGL